PEKKPADFDQKLKNACEVAIKAELASEAKSRFIAYITHEIRTCLNIIMGITQVFEEEEKNKLSQKQKDFITTISDSSRKLLSVTDEVSEFSTREKGDRHFFIKEKIFDLKNMCADIVNDLKPIAQNKGLELNLDIDDSVPTGASADKTKLSHLLYTLLENAIRFTNKGTVKLSVSSISELPDDKSLISFSVSDSGVGISEEKLQKIFDFFDENPAESERTGNVKLGLAVCKYLAESMGGSIKAQSKKESGTTFTIELPVKKAKLQENKAISFSSALDTRKIANFAGKKALLAEDDPINRQIEKLLLTKYGFIVETAINGQDALEKYKSASYDIIFMDCEMPVMNGFTACREIRAIEKEKGNRHIPIIAMTANALAGDKEMCLQAGMDDYVSKPVNIDKLIEATNKYLA
ncbi:MAG TPA: response regulator, partial [Candidatus Moranbacteria bacterium]|nr:response regulator [Candidatus Moranbacteria bacterium]